MKILLINRYFGNDEVPTGRMLRDLSAVLIQRGHHVRVLATSGYRIRLIRLSSDYRDCLRFAIGTGGGECRLLSWFLFWLQASFLTPFLSWDRCVILTDPPFLTVISIITHFLGRRRDRVYWWTMDLYPEAPVAAGLIRNESIFHRFLNGINNLSLRYLTGIICLGAIQRKLLSRYRNWREKEEFYREIPPWDSREIQPITAAENRFSRKYGLIGDKVVLYAGNLGKAHSYSELLAAARWMEKRNPKWKFVFAVRGNLRKSLIRESSDLSNVLVMDYQPAELTADLLRSATVHVITMKEGWEGIVVPSKLYGIFKTTAPVLFIGPKESDTAREIEKYDFGELLPSGASGETVARSLNRLGERSGRLRPPRIEGNTEKLADFIIAEKTA